MSDRIKIRSVSDGGAWGWLRHPNAGAALGTPRPMRIKKSRHVSLFCVAGMLLLTPHALSAAEKYQVYLSAMPFNDATQPIMTGKGSASATLDVDTLSISGTFTGLSGPATKARLSVSRGPGIPGTPLMDLTLAGNVAGKVTGQTKLNPGQLAALRSGKLYIQIDSETVPSGHLWGWLLDEHAVAGQGEPQKGPWFLPPFAVKTK